MVDGDNLFCAASIIEIDAREDATDTHLVLPPRRVGVDGIAGVIAGDRVVAPVNRVIVSNLFQSCTCKGWNGDALVATSGTPSGYKVGLIICRGSLRNRDREGLRRGFYDAVVKDCVRRRVRHNRDRYRIGRAGNRSLRLAELKTIRQARHYVVVLPASARRRSQRERRYLATHCQPHIRYISQHHRIVDPNNVGCHCAVLGGNRHRDGCLSRGQVINDAALTSAGERSAVDRNGRVGNIIGGCRDRDAGNVPRHDGGVTGGSGIKRWG